MSPDEARTAMLAAFAARAGTETVALEAALGRVLARDVSAQRDQPPFPSSAMDGYALRAADAPGRLRVVGQSAAGRGFARALNPGEAVRIFTGAPVPDGANSILIQEEAQRDGDLLTAPAVTPGAHVRARGVDFRQGDVLLRKGWRLDGAALALAAASGAAQLNMLTPPRIAILATGDEIVAPGAAPGPDQIYDACSFGVAGLAASWGAAAQRLQPQGDDLDGLQREIGTALAHADLVVTIGGASVGDHDLVRAALNRLSARFVVEKIAVRPGKPTFFAMTTSGAVLGLPGNPASAMVCAHLFLKPLIETWFGRNAPPAFLRARLAAPLPENGAREHYLRATLRRDGAELTAVAAQAQDSSLLSIMQDADALIRRFPHAPAATIGELVDVLDLGRASVWA